MSSPLPPPPTRNTPPAYSSSSSSAEPSQGGWKERAKGWGKVAVDKSVVISDWAGHKMNGIADKVGSEHFYPVTGDFPEEMNKCARIIRAFTVEGTETTVIDETTKKQKKVLRKIPPKVIKEAVGLCVFTSFRSGIAPFGGAGGAGIVIARLPDGSWSAPSSLSPNNLSAGFMLGIDIYDAILVIRTQKALESFSTHKATLGTDIAVAAGPYGAGAAAEVGLERAPVLSYVRSRGLYAGVQLVGQVFVDRFEENAAMYQWPGIKAGDILSGKVRVPTEAKALHSALLDAESGRAQTLKGSSLDMIIVPEVPAEFELEEGEILHLPPTPTMIQDVERAQGRERSMKMSEEEANELERRLSRVEMERRPSSVYSPKSLGSPPVRSGSGSGALSPSLVPHRGAGPSLPTRRNMPPPLLPRSNGSPLATPEGGSSARSSLDLHRPTPTTPLVKRSVPPPPPPPPSRPVQPEDLFSVEQEQEREREREQGEEVSLSVPEKGEVEVATKEAVLVEEKEEVEAAKKEEESVQEKKEEEVEAGVPLPEYEDVVLDAPPIMEVVEEKKRLEDQPA